MTLRRKTILALAITLIALILLLYVLLRTIMLNSFSTLEQQVTLRNLSRATNSLQVEVTRLQGAITDWSDWDETYQFALDGSEEYVDANLSDSTLWGLGINLMMFVNKDGEIVYTKAVDLDTYWQNNLRLIFENYALTDSRFLHLTTETATSGLVVIEGQPFLIASDMILHSDESGPSTGTLIWAQRLSTQDMADRSQTLRLTMDLTALSRSMPADILAVAGNLTALSSQEVVALDEETVAGYALINDIYAEPAAILRTTAQREIYAQGQVSLNYFVLALVLVGVVFAAGMVLLLERLVLLPLARLSDTVRHLNLENSVATRLPVQGDHELAQVAIAINTLLSRLAFSHTALYESNTKLEIGVHERTTELESQRSQMQSIMDTMGEGLAYSVDGKIAYVNRAFAELLDYQSAELVGKPFALLIAPTDPTQTPIFVTSLQRIETGLARSDGSVVRVAITSSPVKQNDTRNRYVIIVRDITQELANKAQRDNFFARASHDLRSPLTSLMTRLYLLSKKPEQLEAHLKVLNHVANQMLELVNDLLDVSRLEQPTLTLDKREVVLQTLVEQVVEVEQADAELKKIHLCAEMAETPLHVAADSMRLTQVVTNLITNAIRYTPEGGEVTVRVSPEIRHDERCALIHVADTGIGMKPEHLPHIFDPFFRINNERGGSGLGLYIVKEIVALHSGEISVASEINKGTTFTVCLRLSDGMPMPAETPDAASSATETPDAASDASAPHATDAPGTLNPAPAT